MRRTYPTHHCGCDFCNSRRSVNAKKFAVSQRVAQQCRGCNCHCHGKDAERCGKGGAGFDPEYPEPVHQTALNASGGRNGVSGGNHCTIQSRSTHARGSGMQGSGSMGSEKETTEQRQMRVMAELDALERLLILEYKARTQATLEIERLKAGSAESNARRPQPFPAGYTSETFGGSGVPCDGDVDGGTWGGSGSAGSRRNAATIHEAYAQAQACPVAPPAQCHASRRLQDTIDNVRRLTRDPVNPGNRRSLQRLLSKQSISGGSGDVDSGELTSAQGNSAGGRGRGGAENGFGSSLAQLRTSNAHPRGCGVVWVSSAPAATAAAAQGAANNTNVLVMGSGATAGAS